MCFVCLQCKFKKRNLTGDMEDRSHGTSQYKENLFADECGDDSI